MSAYFLDLDGTLFSHGTNELLPGARELLDELQRRGHQVVFTTYRSSSFALGEPLNDQATLKALADLGIEYHGIVFGVRSPRVLVNDDGASAFERTTNEPILEDERLRLLGDTPN